MIIKPMLPTLIKEPFDHPDWIYEIKWDGYRSMAIINGNTRLISKNINVFTRFTQISSSLSKIKYNCILDGEIVVLDEDGRPNFRKLMFSRKYPYTYYVFDILYLKGKCLMTQPITKRKEILNQL